MGWMPIKYRFKMTVKNENHVIHVIKNPDHFANHVANHVKYNVRIINNVNLNNIENIQKLNFKKYWNGKSANLNK